MRIFEATQINKRVFCAIPATINALILTFDDIANVPVADASDVDDWNTFFDLPVNGTPFTSVTVAGNAVNLYGGSGITLKSGLFYDNDNLVSINDLCGCIEIAGTQSLAACDILSSISLPALTTGGWNETFYYLPSITTFSLPSLTTIYNSTFWLCQNATIFNLPNLTTIAGGTNFKQCSSANNIYLPKCTQLGNTVLSNNNFQTIVGNTITLTVPATLMTCNAGSPDGDIVVLQAANTVTVITT